MKQAAKLCHYEKIEHFVPYQPNNYIWLCRGKNALFTHIIVGKLLQGEMCQSLINNMTQAIMKNVAMAFDISVSCLYSHIDSLENPLVCAEQAFYKLFS